MAEKTLISLPQSNLELFIDSNKSKMSRRLYNVLNYAVRNGIKNISELNRDRLYKLQNCGKLTADEFILLTTNPH